MKIDLLNTEAFSNLAFDQMHNTYVLMREERKKTLDKLRTQAIEQIKNKLMEEIHWWQVCDLDGTVIGYGYGTAKGVCNLFACRDYKDCYDEFWVKLLPVRTKMEKQFAATECKYKVVAKMGYDWSLPELQELEEELKRKGLILPEIK
jgi:hypothetical protein